VFAVFCPRPKCGKHEKPNRRLTTKPACPVGPGGQMSERQASDAVKPSDSEAERCRGDSLARPSGR